MFRFFKKGKKRQSFVHPVWQRWAKAMDNRQHKWAASLNRKVDKYSRRSKQIALILFCLLFGGSSICLIIRAVENPSDKIAIEKMSFPKYATGSDSSTTFQPIPILTKKQHEKIQRFKKYMDSLQTTRAGKATYDSIMKARPGLMDSIDFIEQMYRQQTKTK